MREEFIDAAVTLQNRYVREWKAGGKKVVGYTCSYLPDEIFYAAGILPFRIRGYGADTTMIGDTYFGPFICSMPKCMLQLAGEGRFNFLDGVIITPGCDSMRRLDECWRKAAEDIQGIRPPFFFHYGVPHKTADYSLKWFIDETRRLITAVEEHFTITISNKMLSEAIKTYNKGRHLLEEIDRFRIMDEPRISGTEALAVVISGTAMPRDEYNNLLEKFILQINNGSGPAGKKTRLMLVGSANDDVELVRVIEGERALVVSDNLCFGARFYTDYVDEDGDPVEALARRYLSGNDCPRMFGDYKRRLGTLMAKVNKAGVEGVILQNIRFCDLHGSENGIIERDLEAAGIPCMRLEREYGPLVETGRMRMRIEAFLERLNSQ